jgi:Extensin-like protein C-terminus
MRRRRLLRFAAGCALVLALSNLLTAGDKPEPAGPPPPPEKWTATEVEAARADCTKRLSGLHVLSEALGPIREGMCGTPAPLRLKGFDYAPERALTFEPEPVVSCRLAEAMSRWAAEVVQPEAKKRLQTRIVGMVTVASYDCRSRYNDQSQRLSEHAYVDALDVSEFVTEKGERIAIEKSWKAGDERAAFLRAIHEGACRIFGTTLGPEANDAHKNHFHLDMKERRQPLCDFTPEQLKASEEAKKHPPAPGEVECKAMWDKAGGGKDGVLAGKEAKKFLDAMKVGGKKNASKEEAKLDWAQFLRACKDGVFNAVK